MSAINLLVALPVFEPGLHVLRRLLPPGSVVEVVPIMQRPEQVVPAEKLRGKHILCSQLPPANFDEMTDLKWVQLSTVGYSSLYGRGLPERGVRVVNARGVFDAAIAEWCIAMMINLARDVPGMQRNQQQRVWNRDARFQQGVRGTTLGIYGYGGIGRETARLAKCLGVKVWVLSRNPLSRRDNTYLVPGTGDPEGVLPERVFSPPEKFEFLSKLDFLLLAMPHTPQTTGIIGAAELAALPNSAKVLNPARGPLIDEQALLKALRDGQIQGAALDTHYHYPLPPEHPLWRMENVILTPHIAGTVEHQDFLPRIWEILCENTQRFMRGEPLLNEVTPQELHGA